MHRAVAIGLGIIFTITCLLNFRLIPNLNFGINLGLDLKGGASLVMQIDLDQVAVQRLREGLNALSNAGIDGHIKGDSIIIEDTKSLKQVRAILVNMLVVPKKNNLRASFNNQYLIDLKNAVMDATIEKIRKRVDVIGVSDAIVRSLGNSSIIVEVPGVYDTEDLKQAIGKTGKLEFFIVRNDYKPGFREFNGAFISRLPFLTGADLSIASVGMENGMPVILLKFNNKGSLQLARVTRANIGNTVSIMLDRAPVTSGVIRETISGGTAQISGVRTIKQVKNSVQMLNAGALPAEVEIVAENYVGPTIGKSVMQYSMVLFLVALLFTYLYMIYRYGKKAIFSVGISMIFMLIGMVSMLTVLSATLTLYGMAAIILTIGMAVDSNVIVLEEQRSSTERNRNESWNNAYNTIISANITTMIASGILTIFGYGPIKGFGVVMTIGVLSTMITASTVLRLLFFKDPRYNI